MDIFKKITREDIQMAGAVLGIIAAVRIVVILRLHTRAIEGLAELAVRNEERFTALEEKSSQD